jgi:hypothetical protein
VASTDAGICNLALMKLGEKQFIDSLTQPTVSARTCNVVYETGRNAMLEAYPWTFATRHALLPLVEDHTVTPPTIRKAWAYIYDLPADCLVNGQRYLDIGIPNMAPEQMAPFDIEDDATYGPVLLTNEKNAELVYTRLVTEVGKMPALFQNALAWMLAYELTFAIPGKNALREGMVQGFEAAIGQAAISEFKHLTPERKPLPTVIRMRQGNPAFTHFSRR